MLFVSLFSLSFFALFSCSLSYAVNFNSSSPCVALGACSFTDPSIWIGNYVPNNQASVIITSTVPFTMTMEGNKISSMNYMNSLSLKGPITFIFSNVATFHIYTDMDFEIGSVYLYNTTLYRYHQTNGRFLYMEGSKLQDSSGYMAIEFIQIVNSGLSLNVFQGSINASGPTTSIVATSILATNVVLSRISNINMFSLSVSESFVAQDCGKVSTEEVRLSDKATFEYGSSKGRLIAGNVQVIAGSATMILANSSYVSCKNISGTLTFILGYNVTFDGQDYQDSSLNFHNVQTPISANTVIHGFWKVSFLEDTVVYGVININATGTLGGLDIYKSVTIVSPYDAYYLGPYTCSVCVQGTLNLMRGASLECNGKISAEMAVLSGGTITTPTFLVSTFVFMSSANEIYGNALWYQPAISMLSVNIYDATLLIHGNFTLQSVVMHVSLPFKNYTSAFITAQAIQLSTCQMILDLYQQSSFYGGKKMPIMEATSKQITITNSFEAVDDDAGVTFIYTLKDGVLYISRPTLQLYQILLTIAVSAVGIFAVSSYYYFVWKRMNRPAVQEHELQPIVDDANL